MNSSTTSNQMLDAGSLEILLDRVLSKTSKPNQSNPNNNWNGERYKKQADDIKKNWNYPFFSGARHQSAREHLAIYKEIVAWAEFNYKDQCHALYFTMQGAAQQRWSQMIKPWLDDRKGVFTAETVSAVYDKFVLMFEGVKAPTIRIKLKT